MTKDSDRELVERAQCGDRDAFGELAQRHWPMCLRMARKWHPVDPEDLVQSALIEAYRNLHQFRGESAFSTWLARIVITEALMAHRYDRRHRCAPLYTAKRKRWPGPDPETAYAQAELRALFRREIARIDPMVRAVLARDLDDLTVPELAKRLNVSWACAKSRLFRARAELRTRIERRCGIRLG